MTATRSLIRGLSVAFLVLAGAVTSVGGATLRGALEGERHRVLVSTDIGGSDPDDFQSMVHLLLHADLFDLEGLISSPWGPGRVQHIHEVIDRYETDFPNLRSHSPRFPTPAALRAMTKQGAFDAFVGRGFGEPTEGSSWLIARARHDDPRPLWVLVWGTIDDLAQALHDAPEIKDKLRVYYISGPNKKWGVAAYDYIVREHPDLWIIEANSTYRGWFEGGIQTGDLGNASFVERHIKGHGALGDYFAGLLGGSIKMGDTPSVSYLLRGQPDDPGQPGWGGRFIRAWPRPRATYTRATTEQDGIEAFGILEWVFPVTPGMRDPRLRLVVDGQEFPGFYDQEGRAHLTFMPKEAKRWTYVVRSSDPLLDGLAGGFTSVLPDPDQAHASDPCLRSWWTDDPAPTEREGPHQGARTVNRWREDYLAEFARRLDWAQTPQP